MVSLPQQSTILYDGECDFCIRWVERIRRRDGSRCFEYHTLREALERGWIDPGTEQDAQAAIDAGVRLLEPDGRSWIGADAVQAIARRLPRWRRVAWIMGLPGIHWLAGLIYRFIARRRGCLSGLCRVPPKRR
jgi:predicted DCC family thiol-disulfide oxidoreductase YuxK